jgi:Ca-activated chloride channel family protein
MALAVGMAVAATGCGGSAMGGNYGPPGEFGATQGGVQDMTLARSLVDEGKVPPPEAIIVEAMFSEHDLPLEGAPCDTLLCLRAAMGIAPDDGGETSAWVQIGMSSTIDPDAYERPSQTIVVTVDVSGSMGWDYVGDSTPGALSMLLLHEIADRLDENDRFAIVTFGSRSVVHLDLTQGSEQFLIHRKIEELHQAGSTDMESGMRTAYPLAVSALGTTDEVRVMVLSDYQPNVGATSPSDFQRIAMNGAEDGVGLTLFGLGLGLGPAVMSAMSEIRGANAFSLVSPEEVGRLMEDSWPWMVSPIAYDLDVKLIPQSGFNLAGSYGFPGEEGDAQASLEVATVFLSRRKGAMLVELKPAEGIEIPFAEASLQLSYLMLDGTPMTESLTATYEGQPLSDSGKFMPQEGIAKTVALALLVTGMHEAADLYGSNRVEAVEIMLATVNRFTADAAEIGDPAIDAEVDFANAMLALMRSGAPQGNFYP